MNSLTQFFIMLITAMTSQNILFTRSLGTSRLIMMRKEPATILIFGGIMTGMLTVMSVFTYYLNRWVLNSPIPLLLRPILLLAILLGLYLIVEFTLGRAACMQNYKDIIFAACINCAVFGTLLLTMNNSFNLVRTVAFAIGTGLGYILASTMIHFCQKRIEFSKVPKAFKGLPIILLYLGLVSLAFYGLIGHQLPT